MLIVFLSTTQLFLLTTNNLVRSVGLTVKLHGYGYACTDREDDEARTNPVLHIKRDPFFAHNHHLCSLTFRQGLMENWWHQDALSLHGTNILSLIFPNEKTLLKQRSMLKLHLIHLTHSANEISNTGAVQKCMAKSFDNWETKKKSHINCNGSYEFFCENCNRSSVATQSNIEFSVVNVWAAINFFLNVCLWKVWQDGISH